MKTYDPQKPLISIHIPKCAGTSFSDVLKSWFSKGFLPHYFNELKNTPPVKHALYSGFFRKKIKPGLCIHGHFNNIRGTGVLDYYPEVDQLITIIRNPFEVHLSNYFYVKRSVQNGGAYRNGKQHEIIEMGWNLEGYLRENKKSHIALFLPSILTIDNYKEVLDQKFLFMGISEDLQGSVNLLANKLGFSAVEVSKMNESERDEEIPDGALEEFVKNNPLEMAIYTHIKNRFEQQLAEFNAQQKPRE